MGGKEGSPLASIIPIPKTDRMSRKHVVVRFTFGVACLTFQAQLLQPSDLYKGFFH